MALCRIFLRFALVLDKTRLFHLIHGLISIVHFLSESLAVDTLGKIQNGTLDLCGQRYLAHALYCSIFNLLGACA